jgi:hypothetical protein
MTDAVYPKPDSDAFKMLLDVYQNGRQTDVTGWSKKTLRAWLMGETHCIELPPAMFGLDDFSGCLLTDDLPRLRDDVLEWLAENAIEYSLSIAVLKPKMAMTIEFPNPVSGALFAERFSR